MFKNSYLHIFQKYMNGIQKGIRKRLWNVFSWNTAQHYLDFL